MAMESRREREIKAAIPAAQAKRLPLAQQRSLRISEHDLLRTALVLHQTANHGREPCHVCICDRPPCASGSRERHNPRCRRFGELDFKTQLSEHMMPPPGDCAMFAVEGFS